MNKVTRTGLGLAIVTAMASIAMPSSAITQTDICGPRAEVVEQLGLQYDERQKAVGLLGQEAVMEIFVSEHGSWTLLATDIRGESCILAAGEAWDDTFATTVGQGV